MTVNWSYPKCKISKYFTVGEALYLPKWNKLAEIPSEAIKGNILDLARRMDAVRENFGLPIVVHCWYRPPEYNKLIGGAKRSMHMVGGAVDFHIDGIYCDDVRCMLKESNFAHLLRLRIEMNTGGNWVHLDIKKVTNENDRYFKP